ncbi:DUF1254 domain-containing protein [Noviherbaspirillum saxi]|uniref:DUF1254 domain-containing protein n=1 Tax=Noviherbaspirillum saxi TaxID=2320863 RepID=A0A3A3FF59_9BURK|nr:DUF1254 domain-containing protein [Noviherbaspirillum saxi]RJF91880.1 DUF1254 domain-containing protein [Noviherbaspirillum saxi]
MKIKQRSIASKAIRLAISASLAGIGLVMGSTASAMTPATKLTSAESKSVALTPAEARAIAKEAYSYGYSPVDSYRILYSYFVDRNDPEYKGGWNTIYNNARVFTPDDKAMQSPNADTPYSNLGLDLRTEPMVLSVPAVEQNRYYTLQVNDLFTHIAGYIGTRTTGNGAGNFLVAGPNWKGKMPKGIKAVIRSETELTYVFYRTQLFKPDDIENVKKVQAGYKVQPLSAFLGKPAPAAARPIDFMKPLTKEQQRNSLEFFDILNFVLQFYPTTHPSEKALMERFAQLGIGAGKKFDAQAFAPETRKAIEDGIADAWLAIAEVDKQINSGELTSGDIFGSRAHLKNNYLYRMRATHGGIWGLSKEEAIYPIYYVDSAGQKLNGGSNRYKLRFAPGQLPPANAFWSLTMYELPARRLVANPLNRYLINSPMLPDLKRDADGGITVYIQHESPGADKESNWLPTPNAPFFTALRLYWPKAEALNGEWKRPALQRVD